VGHVLTAVRDCGGAQPLNNQQESHIPDCHSEELVAHMLHGIPAGAMYEEFTEALENCRGDCHLAAALHLQVKRGTQLLRESLQELAAAIDHLAHCMHVELPKHLIIKKKPPVHLPME
jgi:hypothetical protein